MNTTKKMIGLGLLALLSLKVQSQETGTQNIKIINCTTNEKADRLYIEWSTDGKVATNYFEVQQGGDGKKFTTLALVLGPDPKQQGDRYQYIQKIDSRKRKASQYRICHIDTAGHKELSEIFPPAK